MDKGLQLLSLCRRAGKLRVGFDAVEQAARRREAAAVLLSRELAERTRRHAEQFCRQTRTPVYTLSYSFDDLAPFLGRRAGILWRWIWWSHSNHCWWIDCCSASGAVGWLGTKTSGNTAMVFC